jgi:hypothetical protein
MTCPYCRGAKVLDNAIGGLVACRVCLGTGEGPYEGDLGHEARQRELRRIAELLPDVQRFRTCPICARTSWHPMDVATGWCAACEDFTGPQTDAELLELAERLEPEPRAALLNRIQRRYF